MKTKASPLVARSTTSATPVVLLLGALTLAAIPENALHAQQAAAQSTPAPIAAWSRTKAAEETQGSATERGAAVFNNWCSACHSRGPMNAPGTTSLEFKYQGAVPAALEDRRDLTPELVSFYVRNGVAMMPFFRPTEISDSDLEALGAYLSKR